MDKNTARHLIRKTFQNAFSKDSFVYFIKNILNYIEDAPFIYRGNFIPDAFNSYIKTLERIGKYQDSEGKFIDILIVQLKKESSLEHARTMQRNFIAWYLNGSRGGKLKDAALVAFVAPNGKDWRFSLVKMEYKLGKTKTGRIRAKEELTPARRYSFLVGVNESSHTAQSRLVPILEDDINNPTLKQLEESFNIEKVTKEFFEKYRELFHWANEELDSIVNRDPAIKRDFDKKDISTVDFTKKLLGQIVFLYFLQKKGWFGVKRGDEWGLGSKRFLRELFEKKHSDYKNFFNEILEPLFYEALRLERPGDYYSRFDCRIPFLNGGLFDPINDYDWWNTDIFLPDEIFSNKRKTKEGDIGDGILDVFDRYNFTVKEDEPLEKEVAVDPEMLGKVFENLLEVKDRKSKGTYYTPREIVHYMCKESLANFLTTELRDKVSKEDFDTLIKYGESVVEHDSRVVNKGRETERYSFKLPESVRKHAKLIDEKLTSIRVCDPAVGSGAFLVGMMNEIIRTRNALTPYISENGERTSYNFKRQAIQNCLYGVDIDLGAVEIAKLRLWLSLIVDEKEREIIQPLPNLDYKIVCGNSLLGYPYKPTWTKEVELLKKRFLLATSPKIKQDLKNQIDSKLKGFLENSDKSLGYRVDFDFEIFFSEVFHEKKGFDVAIANPPYVEHKKLKGISNLFKGRFKTYGGTADLYVYFYEAALNILREKGILTFISSNKFIRTTYGTNLRNLLAKYKIHNLVDFTKVHIFDALVASCIVLVSKDNPADNVIVTFADDNFAGDLAGFIENNHIKVSSASLGDDIWHLEDDSSLQIKQKIESDTKKLGEVEGIKIFRGVTTGFNQAFVIDEDIKNKLVTEDPNSKDIIKPLLQGRNVRKWIYFRDKKFLIFTRQGINVDKYVAVKMHLAQFKKNLEPGRGRKPGQYKWYEIQDNTAYYPEFEKEKVIWGLTADKWAFAYDNEGNFLPSNGYILTSSKLPIKCLLALFNSQLMKFYFSFIGIMTAGGAFTLKHETIHNFPIKTISEKEQYLFIDLVNRILTIAKDSDYLRNSSKQARVCEYEKQIDKLVYKLYDLTAKEIKIVEGQYGG